MPLLSAAGEDAQVPRVAAPVEPATFPETQADEVKRLN